MAQTSNTGKEQPASEKPGSSPERIRFSDGSIARRAFPENPELVSALERIRELELRVGDDKSLIKSSEKIISEVLRKAGETRADEMSRALAPLVVSSMREEIKNSSDEMVSALYPIMGRLVSSYVRSAFVELTEKINKALEENFSVKRWKIRLQAKMSGRSEAELLLSEARPFAVDDLFVIHRKSGLLIARADASGPDAPDADLVGAMLTAIMSFVEDAFRDDTDSTLQAISFGDSRLLVRTTPTLVMTAKITGVQPAEFQGAFDEAMMTFVDRWGQDLMNFDSAPPLPNQTELVENLRAISDSLPVPEYSGEHDDKKSGNDEQGDPKSTLKRFGPAALALVVLAGLIFWWTGESREEQTLRLTTETLQTDDILRRLPLTAIFEDDQLIVRGWVPDQAALKHLKTIVAPQAEQPPIEFDIYVPPNPSESK